MNHFLVAAVHKPPSTIADFSIPLQGGKWNKMDTKNATIYCAI